MVKRITLFLRVHCEKRERNVLHYVSVCRSNVIVMDIVIRRPINQVFTDQVFHTHTATTRERERESKFVCFAHIFVVRLFYEGCLKIGYLFC